MDVLGCSVTTAMEDKSRCPNQVCDPSFNATVIVYSNCTCLEHNLKKILLDSKFAGFVLPNVPRKPAV